MKTNEALLMLPIVALNRELKYKEILTLDRLDRITNVKGEKQETHVQSLCDSRTR